jgi:hypothetical protein
MKTKLLLVSLLVTAGLVASTFAAAGRGKGPGGNQGNPPADQPPAVCPQNPGCPRAPDCTPNPDCPRQNGTCQPKRDGTGGPGKPANPSCPQDGSGCPRA